MNKALKQGLCF